MDKKKKDVITSLITAVVILGLSVFAWLKPPADFSATERRQLSKFPELSFETLGNGSFMSKFETYTLDQFPLRDTFRSIKAGVHKYVFRQSDNNGIYRVKGSLSEMDSSLSLEAVNSAVMRFQTVYDTYIKDSNAKVYLSIIPDKNYFLAAENGYLAYDYDEFYETVTEKLSYMEFIDIRDFLTIEDYYTTDTHWRQEKILDVAKHLGQAMGSPLTAYYETVTLDTPFYGVYYGQYGLPVEADRLSYLENDMLSQYRVFDHENQREIPVYNLDLATGRDGYEMYLSGALSVITIENPNSTTDKELVIFRDSFGSSITPLLAEGYSKITMIDIRYINTMMIGNFVDFESQDVLFLYSTSVLNNTASFR